MGDIFDMYMHTVSLYIWPLSNDQYLPRAKIIFFNFLTFFYDFFNTIKTIKTTPIFLRGNQEFKIKILTKNYKIKPQKILSNTYLPEPIF